MLFLGSGDEHLPFIVLDVLVTNETEYLLLVRILEGPSLRQECVVENVSVLCLKSGSFDDFSKDGAPVVTVHDGLLCVRVHFLLERGWVKEARPNEVLSQLNLFLDKLGK